MFIHTILLACVLQLYLVIAQREGEPCNVNQGAGVCKLLANCPYAEALVEEMKKPTHCSYKGRDEVVCCPAEDIPLYALGKFGRFFSGTNNGKLVSSTMTCYHERWQPITCCHNIPDNEIRREPKSCPPLENEAKKTKQLLWDKCVEYERFVKPCVTETFGSSHRYKRQDTCTQKELANRVTNGEPAGFREFPHMALLGYRAGGETVWVAGGTLISDRYILTAAHIVADKKCEGNPPTTRDVPTKVQLVWFKFADGVHLPSPAANSTPPSQYKFRGSVQFAKMGMLRRSDLDGLIFNVEARHVHKDYNFNLKYNDIALLRLNRRVVLSPDIRPACLSTELVKANTSLIVTGWGRTGASSPLSDVLLKTDIQSFDASKCREIIAEKSLPAGWSEQQMICAGGGDEHSTDDSCEGDSGGPIQMYINEIHCMYSVVGVVSWGPECGKGKPAAYTRVSHYLQWITDIVWPQQ